MLISSYIIGRVFVVLSGSKHHPFLASRPPSTIIISGIFLVHIDIYMTWYTSCHFPIVWDKINGKFIKYVPKQQFSIYFEKHIVMLRFFFCVVYFSISCNISIQARLCVLSYVSNNFFLWWQKSAHLLKCYLGQSLRAQIIVQIQFLVNFICEMLQPLSFNNGSRHKLDSLHPVETTLCKDSRSHNTQWFSVYLCIYPFENGCK